jgi:hypothetical protein
MVGHANDVAQIVELTTAVLKKIAQLPAPLLDQVH